MVLGEQFFPLAQDYIFSVPLVGLNKVSLCVKGGERHSFFWRKSGELIFLDSDLTWKLLRAPVWTQFKLLARVTTKAAVLPV